MVRVVYFADACDFPVHIWGYGCSRGVVLIRPGQRERNGAMKVGRAQVAENRERILDAAVELFRECGIDGISVAGLMQHAGLTHGAFYSYFDSKEDLLAQACSRDVARTRERWSALAATSTEAPLKALAQSYLARHSHEDHAGRGCLYASLGAELARRSPAVRHPVTDELRRLIDFLSGIVPGRSKAMRRQRALASYASLVGGLVLARAVDDEALSNEILCAVAASLHADVSQG